MGCQHSKYETEGPAVLRIEAQPTATKDGIECFADPVIETEETPHEIRNIRNELFPKSAGSILTTTSSSAETSSTTAYSRSFGSGYSHDDDSTVRQIGYSNTGCRFLDYTRNKVNEEEENEDEDDESEVQRSCPARKGRSGGRRASFESGNRYHYPVSLYEDLKSQKHFVPTTSTDKNGVSTSIKNLRQRSRTSLPSIRSGITSMSGRCSDDDEEDDDDEGSSSCISSPGGLSSFEGDQSVDESQVEMFPQFEALVDTMALSLEPEYKEDAKKLTKKSVLSFGALVDKLTEMEGDFLDGDDDEGDEEKSEKSKLGMGNYGEDDMSVANWANGLTIAPNSNSRVRAPTTIGSKNRRYSAPAPLLEPSDSSALLANMKTLALMAHGQDSQAVFIDKRNDDDYCSMSSKTLKYHRSSSVAPSSSASVCSEMRWM